MNDLEVATLTLRELLEASVSITSELRKRGYVRTGTSLAGELMEHVVARAYGARLEAPVNAGWDAIDADNRRLQVKTRFLDPGARRPFTFKNLEFDVAILVRLDATTFAIDWAREISRTDIESLLTPHSSGHRLSPARAVANGADVAQRLRDALAALV
ncbi:hypothetical protein [Xylanimonas protaetiae]|uniref:Uncharacterized protein n=1 Tax=Xylanimonas protaetiae TaxID=2509457 RepID=A0A4P6F7G8_9MICO|nr:hypothetical protein [Xylanimonas protaetiae]QAY71435.1 hypothetical protein ET471_16520 [Xylanimonas protaetiae]